MTRDDDETDGERTSVLAPDDLDITADERVAEIEDGRFVISAGGEPPKVVDTPPASDETERQFAGSGDVESSLDERTVRSWLLDSLEGVNAHYGFDVTAKVDEHVDRHRLLSDDITVTFETLLTWYAQQVGRDTPVEEVLGILLHESTVEVRYPPEVLLAACDRYDLDPADSIQTLVAAARNEDGLVLTER